MKKNPISYSRATLYEGCRYRYRAEVFQKIRAPGNPPLWIGSFLHALTETYSNRLIQASAKTDHADFDKLFEKLWKGREGNKDYGALPESAMPEVEGLARTLRTELVVDPVTVVGVELRVALTQDWKPTGWFDDDVWLRGIVDRLECSAEGRLKVWDLKTGYAIEKEPLQQQLYAPMVRAGLPESQEAVDVEIYHLRHGYTRVSEVGDTESRRATRWIERVSERLDASVRDNKWPASPGPDCEFCPVFSECPAKKQAVEFRSAVNLKEAKALLRRLILLDVDREKIRQGLRGWVSMNGPLQDGQNIATLRSKRVRSYEVSPLMMLLTEAKVLDPYVFFRADNRAVDKLISKDKDFAAKVADIEHEAVYANLEIEEAPRGEDGDHESRQDPT